MRDNTHTHTRTHTYTPQVSWEAGEETLIYAEEREIERGGETKIFRERKKYSCFFFFNISGWRTIVKLCVSVCMCLFIWSFMLWGKEISYSSHIKPCVTLKPYLQLCQIANGVKQHFHNGNATHKEEQWPSSPGQRLRSPLKCTFPLWHAGYDPSLKAYAVRQINPSDITVIPLISRIWFFFLRFLLRNWSL